MTDRRDAHDAVTAEEVSIGSVAEQSKSPLLESFPPRDTTTSGTHPGHACLVVTALTFLGVARPEQIVRSFHEPDQLAERMQHQIHHWLGPVHVTPWQHHQIDATVLRSAQSLAAQMAARQRDMPELVSTLSTVEVDGVPLESMRQRLLALANALSAEVLDTLSSIVGILEPEQRTRLIELLSDRLSDRQRHQEESVSGRER